MVSEGNTFDPFFVSPGNSKLFSASFSIDENYFTPEEDENETDQPQTQPKSNQEDQTHAQNQAKYHGFYKIKTIFWIG